jgi:hypothetical protein
VVCTAAGFILFFALIAAAGPSRATVMTYVNPGPSRSVWRSWGSRLRLPGGRVSADRRGLLAFDRGFTAFSPSGGTYTGPVADERPAALDVLALGYLPLFDRARGVFEADDRVRALWLSGSVARGVADAAADLDLLIAVRHEDCQTFAASWWRSHRRSWPSHFRLCQAASTRSLRRASAWMW